MPKLEISLFTLGLILWIFIKDVSIFSFWVKYVSILSVVVDSGNLEIKADLAFGMQWSVFDEEVVKEVFGEDGFFVGLLDSGNVLFFLLLVLKKIEDCMTEGIGGVASRRLIVGIDGDWVGVMKGGEDGGEGESENIESLWFLVDFLMGGSLFGEFMGEGLDFTGSCCCFLKELMQFENCDCRLLSDFSIEMKLWLACLKHLA